MDIFAMDIFGMDIFAMDIFAMDIFAMDIFAIETDLLAIHMQRQVPLKQTDSKTKSQRRKKYDAL